MRGDFQGADDRFLVAQWHTDVRGLHNPGCGTCECARNSGSPEWNAPVRNVQAFDKNSIADQPLYGFTDGKWHADKRGLVKW
jgi:hypothetical protein